MLVIIYALPYIQCGTHYLYIRCVRYDSEEGTFNVLYNQMLRTAIYNLILSPRRARPTDMCTVRFQLYGLWGASSL